MSVIGVRGIPMRCALMNVVKMLAKTINGHFEALNFKSAGKSGKMQQMKICYLRLSERLDPVRVVEKINTASFPGKFRPFAFIPDHVPDIPLAVKPRALPNKMRRKLRIPDDDTPEQVLELTHAEVMTELQLKYPGLYHLSYKMDHKVLEELAMKIHDRLKILGDANTEALESAFKMSQWYRKMHPHFGDFQLVLSTLHAVEDAAGVPRTQIQEKELSAVPTQPCLIGNLPFNQVQQACNKYSDRIIKKITEHIKNLKSEVLQTDNGEEIVRKKVREELKKLTPFLPLIVKQVVTRHFIPEKQPYYRIRIYGEPFLPSKDTMAPFTRRYGAIRIIRSTRMYNMIRFNVPPANYASLMAMDGTVLNGAKLVIRSSDMPQYKPTGNLCAEDEADTLMEAMEVAEEWDETQ